MAADINHVKSTVRRWLEDHPEAVLFDQESATLLDVASGKAVKLPWNEVRALEEKNTPKPEAPIWLFYLKTARRSR